MPRALVVQPTITPSTGSSHHCPNQWSTTATGMPSSEPEDEAEGHHQVQLALAEVAEDPHHERRILLEVVDHHDLRVEQLVDVHADLVGDACVRRSGSWAWTRAIDRLRGPRRGRSRQRFGCSRAMMSSIIFGHVRLEDRDDVLGDLVGLELLVELRRRTELGDRLVHRDAAHLRGARRHDALPADAALQEPGHLLDLARQHPRELPHARAR